jgi:anti-sigma regulatory factor (Ser/Thr protein kinase)
MNCPDIRIEIRSKPKLLRGVRELLRCYVRGGGFAPEVADDVVLAVDEACANAIRHSYAGSCDERLELLAACDADGIEIVVSDDGTPAPARRIAPKEQERPDPATVKPGGLGLSLIFKVFDEVVFRPGAERGNRVVMRLKRRDGNREGTARHGT